MSGFLQDVRYALRQLRHNPAVSLIVVLTIALGIGVNTAVFSLLNGVDRPLPIKEPDQIVVIAADTKGDETGFRFNFSYSALQDIRRQADAFSDVFGSGATIGGISNGGTASRFFYASVTGNFFQALGIRPALGRFFEPGEGENPGSDLTAVVGHAFWQKQFGGDPNIIGKQVRINGRSATIVGVAPNGFHGIYAGVEMDGYMTLRSQAVLARTHSCRNATIGSTRDARHAGT